MKPQIKKLWVDELKSGRYRQGQGSLKRNDDDTGRIKHCCLGVLCEIYQRTVNTPFKFKKSGDLGLWSFGDEDGTPPKAVMRWAGLSEMDIDELIAMNDGENVDNKQYKFYQIANYINKNL